MTVVGTNDANEIDKDLTFKNNAAFKSCISKVNKTLRDNTEDLDIVMPMYNLSEYSDNYFMTSEILWNYYKDEVNDDVNENDDAGNYMIKNSTGTTSKYFEYNTKIIGSTPAK